MTKPIWQTCDNGKHVADATTGSCPCGWVSRARTKDLLDQKDRCSVKESIGALFPEPLDRAFAADAVDQAEKAKEPAPVVGPIDSDRRTSFLIHVREGDRIQLGEIGEIEVGGTYRGKVSLLFRLPSWLRLDWPGRKPRRSGESGG